MWLHYREPEKIKSWHAVPLVSRLQRRAQEVLLRGGHGYVPHDAIAVDATALSEHKYYKCPTII